MEDDLNVLIQEQTLPLFSVQPTPTQPSSLILLLNSTHSLLPKNNDYLFFFLEKVSPHASETAVRFRGDTFFLHLHEIVEGLYFHSSLSVCLSVCVSGWILVNQKFQPNGWTDLNAIFAKWLLKTLAQTLLELVTLGQRSRSLWQKMYLKLRKKNR